MDKAKSTEGFKRDAKPVTANYVPLGRMFDDIAMTCNPS